MRKDDFPQYACRKGTAIQGHYACEANPVRYAFSAAPTQGTPGLGHLLPVGGQTLIEESGNIPILNFINSASGAPGVLHVTPYF
jgi:hypothetical protein